MKISLKWLCDFVDVADYLKKPEPLAEILTRAGLEVEDIQNKSKDFNFVVTGIILKKDQHPNADKLSLCQVMTSEGVVHQIVCGAKNHKQNDKVVVALPGAVLPGNFAIKTTQLRGVESGGMLCSYKELGLTGDADGIIILPPETPIGVNYAELKGLDDVTFELKVTPNRADCLSHYGLAREIACLLGRELKRPTPMFPQSQNSTKDRIALQVKDSEGCPRYAGRFIAGVKVGPSPDWLKNRLESVGMNSINNVVDVTNYVMMELGQPLHAFDSAKIRENGIRVAKSEAGQSFETLDGTQLKLTGDELMIQDGVGPVALAGVVGGKNSGVSDDTQNVFLEAAYFDPAVVRRQARRFGVNTDSGYRFSRGVDPEGTRLAMDRATELLLKVAGGEAYGDVHDVYPKPVKKAPVRLKVATVSQRLGYECDAKVFEDWMKRLGCEVKTLADGELEILPPTFRFDLEMEMDLVEEYARLHGYDHIPEAFPPVRKEPLAHDALWVAQNRVAQILRGHGFNQAANFAFVGEKAEREFLQNENLFARAGFEIPLTSVKLRNPLSDDLNVMRKSLALGLYKNVHHNFHQGMDSGALFEIGPAFGMAAAGDYREEFRVAAVVWGDESSLWQKEKPGFPVFALKSALQNLFHSFGLAGFDVLQPRDRGEIPQFLHRGQAGWVTYESSGDVKNGSSSVFAGYLGSLHPRILDEDKIRVPVAIFEILLKPFANSKAALRSYKPFSRFPSVTRDLSLQMPKALHAGDVMDLMHETSDGTLRGVDVFDVFEGGNLPAGQKSVSFRLVFQDNNGTLQDARVQAQVDGILAAAKQKWSLTVR